LSHPNGLRVKKTRGFLRRSRKGKTRKLGKNAKNGKGGKGGTPHFNPFCRTRGSPLEGHIRGKRGFSHGENVLRGKNYLGGSG